MKKLILLILLAHNLLAQYTIDNRLVLKSQLKTINSTSLIGGGDLSLQAPITLTTTGTSGAATLSSGVLNIPQYSGGSSPTFSASSSSVSITSTSAVTLMGALALAANKTIVLDIDYTFDPNSAAHSNSLPHLEVQVGTSSSWTTDTGWTQTTAINCPNTGLATSGHLFYMWTTNSSPPTIYIIARSTSYSSGMSNVYARWKFVTY